VRATEKRPVRGRYCDGKAVTQHYEGVNLYHWRAVVSTAINFSVT
jgi:hypothetical protein